jgi:hypothetical protein
VLDLSKTEKFEKRFLRNADYTDLHRLRILVLDSGNPAKYNWVEFLKNQKEKLIKNINQGR